MFGLYQSLFTLFAVSVVGVLLGFKMAIHIHNPVLYILFWVMYFISFLCLLSLLFSLYIFDSIKDRTGPKGLKGEKGESGEMGDTGVCKSNCRDAMFYYELMEHSNRKLNELEKSDGKPVEISNKYWKDRITMIVSSEEFTALMMVKKRDNTLKYIKGILDIWIELLYKAGGRLYFESIGAENEFEWKGTNPWYEIKKYDMYYWGMNKMFKIQKFDKCREPTPKPDLPPRLYTMRSNQYQELWHHKRNTGRNHTPHTIWKPIKQTEKGRDMYPLGDIFVNNRKEGQWNFTGEHIRDHIRFNGSYNTGPGERTILVGGDVKKPVSLTPLGKIYYKYCADWLCKVSGYRIGKKRSRDLYLYRLNPPPGYKCIGIAGTRWGQPNLNDYRCIPNECAEPTHHKSKFHFGAHGGYKVHKFGNNNNDFDQTGHLITDGAGQTFYKIKDSCLARGTHPPEDPVYNKGWHPNPPKKDKKYSVMNYLALPSEAILVNKGDNKIFIKVRHIQGKRYNTYFVIQHSGGPEVKEIFESKLEAINPRVLKWKRNLETYDLDTFRFTINNNENVRGEMTIMSEAHNQYLRMTHPRDIKLVHHNGVDNYAYWKIHG